MKFTVFQPMEEITDSMMLDSDTTICRLEKDGYLVEIETRGAVRVEFKGSIYTRPSEFPEELKELIKRNPNIWETEENVSMHDNNWFELFIYDGKDRAYLTSVCLDIEGETEEELKEECEFCLINYINSMKKATHCGSSSIACLEYRKQKEDGKKYVLVSVCDRDIATAIFDTKEAAYNAMKKEYKEACSDPDSADGEITDESAYLNEGNNHADYDWKIVEVEVSGKEVA